MPRPIHFEIHASDPEALVAFYTSLFGWTFQKWGDVPYWILRTGDGPGIDGGLVMRRGDKPAEGSAVSAWVCTIDVENVDTAVSDVVAAGGSVALPKMAVPGVGW